MTEETHDAATAGPRGIVMSIVVSLIAGLGPARSASPSPSSPTTARSAAPTGVPPAQIFIDAVGDDRRQAAAAHRHRRAAVLRHGVGDRQLPDDLRLLPRRRAARLARSGTGSTRAPARPPTPSGWPPAARSCWACPTCGTSPRTRRSPRSRSSASTSPTCMPTLLRLRQGDAFERGPVAPRPLEPADRHRRGGLGRLHHRAVHAAAGQPRHAATPSTTRRSPCSSCSASPGSGGWSRPASGSPGPKVQGTPEELAAIEARAGEPGLTCSRLARHRRPSPSRTCAVRSSTATSTRCSSRSPTCRAGCRASGCTPGTSWTTSWSTPPRAATTCWPSTST